MESRDDVKEIRIGAMEQLGAIPKVLKELQELVPLLSIAYSTDGRTFGYEAPLSMSIPVGSYVALTAQGDGEYLGQVVTKEVSVRQGAEIGLELDPSLSALLPEGISFSSSHTYPLQRRYAHGSGVILGKLENERYVPTTNEDGFQSADLAPAGENLVAAYLAAEGRAKLDVGRALYTEGRVRVPMKAEGFDRHTFLCGQSGSGKTFALGVILERLLLETELKVIILDPNSGKRLWCESDEPSLIDMLEGDWRCLIVDSGKLGSPADQSIVAMAVLGYFWRHRNKRQPVLIVADEAHNICPQQPADNLEAAATSHAIKIAGEGRKFGLYLLLAS